MSAKTLTKVSIPFKREGLSERTLPPVIVTAIGFT